MLKPVVIMLKRITGIIRRVNASALNLSCKVLLKGFQGKEIITIDKHVTHPLAPPKRGLLYSPLERGVGGVFIPLLRGVRGVSIRLFGVFNQNTRFQLRLVFLAYPCEFKFLIMLHFRLY
jgi:hypothetical protein